MKILVTEPEYFGEDALSVLRERGEVETLRISRKELLQKIKEFDAVLIRIETKLDRELLDNAAKLKVIGSATTGLNHIDTKLAKERGIKIVNLHGAHTIPTAEYAFAMLLSLVRNLPWAYESLRDGRWERHKLIGRQLNGKRIGIIGLGRIGNEVAKYAEAFGMDVVAFDPYAKSQKVRMLPLEKLLAESDVITIHAMLTDETRGMIGRKEFGMMKDGAFLVNTARAEIVDSDALIEALEGNKLGGAAIDVFENEPAVEEDRILRYARKKANLLVTPHLSASTVEAARSAAVEIAKGVCEALDETAQN